MISSDRSYVVIPLSKCLWELFSLWIAIDADLSAQNVVYVILISKIAIRVRVRPNIRCKLEKLICQLELNKRYSGATGIGIIKMKLTTNIIR